MGVANAPAVPPRARNPEIPPGLEALILQLMSKQPDDRPASAGEVLRELKRPDLLYREAVQVRELSVLERIERGRMVGRDRQMREGTAGWREVVAGRGRMLLVSGEPGIGKTRLVRELMTHAEIAGGRALLGSCYAEGGVPFAPFAQILRRAHRDGAVGDLALPESVAADLVALAPTLLSHYPDVQPNPQMDDPRAEQHRLFENMLLFFSLLSERAPLLLVLEDAHWADSGTLFLLRHLARRTRHQRVMLVATYREVELDQARPWHEVLLDLERERLAARLKLPRLDRGETEEMLGVLLAEAITPELLEGIYRETEGNPFFIEEVVKALVESGKLTYIDGRWHRPEITDLGIPQSVRVAIQSRVGVMPADCQEVLRLAAVLGREFDFDTLVRAGGLQQEALIQALEEAERAQLIEELGGERGGTYAFVHGLFASTLVEGLRTLERRGLHRQAAAAIEALRPEDHEALARHHGEAGNLERAADHLLLAADRARVLYAHAEAIRAYTRALDYLKEQGDWDRAARTQMMLGLAHHNAFDFLASRRAYEEGFALWRQAEEVTATAGPSAPHPLRVSSPEPTMLDPGLAADDISGGVIRQLFSGLVSSSPEMGVNPDVARSWDVLDHGRKYVFHLRGDVCWSDGTPVTARDFEYAWKRVLDPVSEFETAGYLYGIKGARAYHRGQEPDPARVGVRAVGEATLAVELEEPAGYFLQLLTSFHAFPVPRHAVETYGESWAAPDKIVTNGPFRLVCWGRGESLSLERNPGYHGLFRGNVQRVELSFWEDQPVKALEWYGDDRLETLHLSYLPPAQRDRARRRYVGEYLAGPMLWTQYMGFDLRRPPFDDRRVRRAFGLATDRETLTQVVQRGYFFPATGGLVPPGMAGHSPDIGLPYHPAEARDLLAEAGYPRGQGFPVLECLEVTGFKDFYEYLRAQWLENLGIDITWTHVEWERLLDRLSGERPHMWISGWSADYSDPDSFLRAAGWRATSGWQNEAYDRLVEEAQGVMDQEGRMRIYRQADRILVDDAPILPLAYGRSHMLVKPWVRKYPISPMGWFFWKDVVIEPH